MQNRPSSHGLPSSAATTAHWPLCSLQVPWWQASVSIFEQSVPQGHTTPPPPPGPTAPAPTAPPTGPPAAPPPELPAPPLPPPPSPMTVPVAQAASPSAPESQNHDASSRMAVDYSALSFSARMAAKSMDRPNSSPCGARAERRPHESVSHRHAVVSSGFARGTSVLAWRAHGMPMPMRATIAHLAHDQQERHAGRVVFHHYRDGHWQPVTWRQAAEQSHAIAAGLWELGCRRGDKIAILSESRYEWCLVDLAVLGLGGVVVGIYAASTAEQARYILEHSESRVLFVEDAHQLAKIAPLRDRLPRLGTVVCIAPPAEPAPANGPGDCLSLSALCEKGRALGEREPELLDRCLEAVQPEDTATIVYTSGTTGPPKGAVLTHRNLFEIADVTCRAMDLGQRDVSAVFLPLAHSLQRVALYAGLRAGVTGYFAPSLERLSETWQQAQPTIMASVPRIFEKIHARILQGLAEQPAHRRAVFRAAVALGRAVGRRRQRGERVPLPLGAAHAALDRLVLSRLRDRIFGRRLRYLISGGAPIGRELLEFFHALGVLVLEGYGLTETSAPATVNRPDAYRLGTVGRPLRGTEVKIAADGEILIRGPGVFREYFKDAEATAQAFDPDGWFCSGDIGEIDEDGFLRVTDRKKDIIVTAAGKNVAPQNIENLLKADPLLGQVMVHGDRRNYLTALIALDPENLRRWAEEHGRAGASPAELCREDGVQAAVQAIVDDRNRELARYETVKKFRIVPEDFTVDNGMLTPTLKIKRRVIEQRYAALLDEMYEQG
ncbi:MAG: long-chain fatty acid--CoA ligase [Deltaproteobacteria bacterium]|nr:long-chain fatty acid--CoA ligase [Deltaproteobacteria bacterium]